MVEPTVRASERVPLSLSLSNELGSATKTLELSHFMPADDYNNVYSRQSDWSDLATDLENRADLRD